MEKIGLGEVTLLKLGGFQFTVLKTDILQRTVFKKDMFGLDVYKRQGLWSRSTLPSMGLKNIRIIC